VWHLLLADAASANAIVHELGFDSGRAVVFDTVAVSRGSHIILGAIAFFTASLCGTVVLESIPEPNALFAPLILVLTAIFYTTMKKRQRAAAVTVGADGIRIDAVKSEFIRLDAIRAVEQQTRAIASRRRAHRHHRRERRPGEAHRLRDASSRAVVAARGELESGPRPRRARRAPMAGSFARCSRKRRVSGRGARIGRCSTRGACNDDLDEAAIERSLAQPVLRRFPTMI
jgi:hypothetical protein